MQCLDYRSVVGRKPESDSEKRAYVLQLGGVALEPISYEILLALQECPAVIRRLLHACFLDKPVMWEDASVMFGASYAEQLHEIDLLLSAVDQDLRRGRRPGDSMLAQIVGLWRDLTHETRRSLARQSNTARGRLTRSGLAEYRRRALAFVDALRQLLPADDSCAVETRERLRRTRAELKSLLPAGASYLAEASWRRAADPDEGGEPGFVTWGIP